MDKKTTFLWSAGLGAGIGAGLMFFLDPVRGRRRRSLIREKAFSIGRRMQRATGKMSRDLGNRAHGVVARAQHHPEQISDDVLVARVRSRIGRVVSHPHAVGISAREGAVTLSGTIPGDEMRDLLSCVARVEGVRHLENRLATQPEPARP